MHLLYLFSQYRQRPVGQNPGNGKRSKGFRDTLTGYGIASLIGDDRISSRHHIFFCLTYDKEIMMVMGIGRSCSTPGHGRSPDKSCPMATVLSMAFPDDCQIIRTMFPINFSMMDGQHGPSFFDKGRMFLHLQDAAGNLPFFYRSFQSKIIGRARRDVDTVIKGFRERRIPFCFLPGISFCIDFLPGTPGTFNGQVSQVRQNDEISDFARCNAPFIAQAHAPGRCIRRCIDSFFRCQAVVHSLFYQIIEMAPFHEGIGHGIIRYDGHVFQQIIFLNIRDKFRFQ